MSKLLFAFKEDVLSGQFPISRIKRLFRLRNYAMHFKAVTASSIIVTTEEMIAIWNEVGQLFERIEGEPTKEMIEHFRDQVAKKWFV